MGGVIIIIELFQVHFYKYLKNIYVWTLIFNLALGALGLLDDILKIKHKNSQGLKSDILWPLL